MYAYLGTHKHTNIFLIRLVFICRLVVEIINGIHFGDCTITASESLISVRLFIFVRSETRSTFLPFFCTLFASEMQKNEAKCWTSCWARAIYTPSNNDGHQSQSTIYVYISSHIQTTIALVCVRPFLSSLFYSIALNSSGPSLFPLNSFACVRVRARAHAFSLLYRTKCINLEFYADNRSSTTKTVRRRKCIATEIFECLSVDLRVCMYRYVCKYTNDEFNHESNKTQIQTGFSCLGVGLCRQQKTTQMKKRETRWGRAAKKRQEEIRT